jgi:5-methylcytosine-specific restriction endonuclease McrBC GTP-binding regulatory subunit McrB
MNTADQSVEAIDTALRRRFAFIPKMPESSKLKTTEDNINLEKMLISLNKRLTLLKDLDHTIGHAWLWDVKEFRPIKGCF